MDCPGDIIFKEFMIPTKTTAIELAEGLKIPIIRMIGILEGRREITNLIAIRLARYFGNSKLYWINLQIQYDLEKAKRKYRLDQGDK
jgi:addiction module HigA family antidote